MLNFIRKSINPDSAFDSLSEITFDKLVEYIAPSYRVHLETLYENYKNLGVTDEQFELILFKPYAGIDLPLMGSASELYHDLKWSQRHCTAPHNGLAVQFSYNDTFLAIKVGEHCVEKDGHSGVLGSNADYCETFIQIKKDGLKFTHTPGIFGVKSEQYEDWSTYYGDPEGRIQGQYPENRIPHHRLILELAKRIWQKDPQMTEHTFYKMKDWAFKDLFRSEMPEGTRFFHMRKKRTEGVRASHLKELLAPFSAQANRPFTSARTSVSLNNPFKNGAGGGT